MLLAGSDFQQELDTKTLLLSLEHATLRPTQVAAALMLFSAT
jgi:hypothetical protein